MIEVESRVLELASEALDAFCEDISGKFDVEMECEQQEITTVTVAGLKKRFKKLAAVNIVDSEGILDGTFQLIFDQEGLFTIGGIMVMLPEKRILANRKDASADLAESMVDAVGEAGNLLVGAWERIFRQGLEGHGRLLQRLPAFVGKPWDKPQDKIGLSRNEEHIFIPFKMTIAPYPAFNGGVILPKKIFEGKPASEAEDAAPTEEDAAQEPRQEQAAAEAQDNAEPKLPDAKKKAGGAKSPASKSKPKRPQAAKKKNTKKDEPEHSETPETSEEPATGPVSSAIKKLARSQVNGTSEILWISAKDVMQTRVVWASPDESVQQALIKFQQNDVGYLAVGGEEALEGIVSKADLAGAMSPYLRPMFARWRRPTDDATLKIKLKWIMSRPVRTAGLDTPLATILENMCRFGGRVLPVVDEQGKVHGLVTAFDIFQMLLNLGADCPTAGKAAQGPPL